MTIDDGAGAAGAETSEPADGVGSRLEPAVGSDPGDDVAQPLSAISSASATPA
ncbi:MAG: hypothetical protein ACTHMQ_02430 [Protaetiibacter sp.]